MLKKQKIPDSRKLSRVDSIFIYFLLPLINLVRFDFKGIRDELISINIAQINAIKVDKR